MSIMVSEIIKTALSADDGKKIREIINKELEVEDVVTLDFSNITLFATMFFNAFIGYFIMNSKKEIVDKRINIINISELGKKTYEHSYSNAVFVKNNNIDVQKAINDSINGDE